MNQASPFSVVIPAYNAQSTLGPCLQSVMEQTHTPRQIVVVDDGSTDSTPFLAQRLLERQPIPYILVKQYNQGLGAARNAGIKACEAPWIALLDADDLWHPTKLQVMNSYIQNQKRPVDVYTHSLWSLDGGRDRKAKVPRSLYQLCAQGMAPIPSASVILKTSLNELNGFSQDRAHLGAEDFHLWARMIKRDMRFVAIPQFLGHYRYGGMSTQLQTHLNHVFATLHDLLLKGILNEDLVRQARNRKHYEAGRFLQKQGEFKRAMLYYDAIPMHLKAAVFKLLAEWRIKL